MVSAISIGCQAGGPDAGSIGFVKVGLFHAFEKHVSSTHCAEIDEYGLVLRVDGSLQKFGPEGITRLRFSRKQRYITTDIQIPESVWRPKTQDETKAYLAQVVKAAIVLCVARLKKDKLFVNEGKLFPEVNIAISEFLGSGREG